MEQANDVIYPDLKLSEIHAGRFCSVRLPRSVPFFDCRIVDEDIRNVRTPWGTVLWSAERAAAALGMVTETCKYGHQRRLMGVQFYFDAREIVANSTSPSLHVNMAKTDGTHEYGQGSLRLVRSNFRV